MINECKKVLLFIAYIKQQQTTNLSSKIFFIKEHAEFFLSFFIQVSYTVPHLMQHLSGIKITKNTKDLYLWINRDNLNCISMAEF